MFISNTFYPGKPDAEEEDASVPSWELRVEGRLLEDVSGHGVRVLARSLCPWLVDNGIARGAGRLG